MNILFKLNGKFITVDTETLIGVDPLQSEFVKTIEAILQCQEGAKYELTNAYNALRDKKGALTRSEAIAISVVKRALCQLEPGAVVPNPLASLPKNKWWRLFIDHKYQADYDCKKNVRDDASWALRFDLEQSPGFFNALMTLYEEVLALIDPEKPLQKITAEIYQSFHQRVTNKGLVALSHTYMPVDPGWSGYGVSFGMDNLVRPVPNPEALIELVNTQELGIGWQDYENILKGIFPDGVTSEDKKILLDTAQAMQAVVKKREIAPPDLKVKAPEAFTTCLIVKVDDKNKTTHYSILTNYPEKQGPTTAAGYLSGYYEEQKSALTYRQKLRAIVKCIRSLHVAHLFPDANGRLNILLLLNCFLLQAGGFPVILRDPAVFGGALTLDELISGVELGQNIFQEVVTQEKQ